MIDIIIPAYNAANTIEKTLLSILMQSYSDKINVYIVNDCSDYDYSKYIHKYEKYINIKELITNENRGPGVARNYGIDNSNGKYIIFLDSDDILYNYFSVETLFKTIEKEQADVVVSSFLHELDYNNYVCEQSKNIWNHGKIYRRDYLKNNNIYFASTKTNEDLYFNYIVELTGAKYFYIDDITYVWQNNVNSLTRCNDNEYRYTALYDYNRSIFNAVIECEKRNVIKSGISKVLCYCIIQMYYTYLRFINSNELEYANNLINAVHDNVIKYNEYKEYINKNEFLEILRTELEKSYYLDLDVVGLPSITFNDFIQRCK